MIRLFGLAALMLLAACTEETSPKEAEKAAEASAAEDMAVTVKTEKKTLEEAADAAAKLVEEESRQEIEATSQQ